MSYNQRQNVINVTANYYLITATLTLHFLAYVVIALVNISYKLKITATLWLLYSTYSEFKYYSKKKFITQGRYKNIKHWELYFANQERIFVKLIPPLYITNNILILNFKGKFNHKKYKIIITMKDLNTDQSHKLKFLLKRIKL